MDGSCLNCGRAWVQDEATENSHGCSEEGNTNTRCPHCGWCALCDEVVEPQLYEIFRSYNPRRQKAKEILKRDLTLKEVQAHCNDPATSEMGEWFDGYQRQD